MDSLGILTNAAVARTEGLAEQQASQLGGAPRSRSEARAAAQDFEAFFLGQFATLMFAGTGQDEYFSGGPAEDIYRTMLGEEIGKTAARSGGVGIADMVYREIIKLQEVATP